MRRRLSLDHRRPRGGERLQIDLVAEGLAWGQQVGLGMLELQRPRGPAMPAARAAAAGPSPPEEAAAATREWLSAAWPRDASESEMAAYVGADLARFLMSVQLVARPGPDARDRREPLLHHPSARRPPPGRGAHADQLLRHRRDRDRPGGRGRRRGASSRVFHSDLVDVETQPLPYPDGSVRHRAPVRGDRAHRGRPGVRAARDPPGARPAAGGCCSRPRTSPGPRTCTASPSARASTTRTRAYGPHGRHNREYAAGRAASRCWSAQRLRDRALPHPPRARRPGPRPGVVRRRRRRRGGRLPLRGRRARRAGRAGPAGLALPLTAQAPGPRSWKRWASMRRRRPKSLAPRRTRRPRLVAPRVPDGADQPPADPRALVAQQEGHQLGGHLGRRGVAAGAARSPRSRGRRRSRSCGQRRLVHARRDEAGRDGVDAPARLLGGEVLGQAHRGDLGEGVGRVAREGRRSRRPPRRARPTAPARRRAAGAQACTTRSAPTSARRGSRARASRSTERVGPDRARGARRPARARRARRRAPPAPRRRGATPQSGRPGRAARAAAPRGRQRLETAGVAAGGQHPVAAREQRVDDRAAEAAGAADHDDALGVRPLGRTYPVRPGNRRGRYAGRRPAFAARPCPIVPRPCPSQPSTCRRSPRSRRAPRRRRHRRDRAGPRGRAGAGRAPLHPGRRRRRRPRVARGQRLPQDLRHRELRAERQRLRAHGAGERRGLGHGLPPLAARLAADAPRRDPRVLGRRRLARAQHQHEPGQRDRAGAARSGRWSSAWSARTTARPPGLADHCIVVRGAPARAADAAHRGLSGRGLAPAGLAPGARDARRHLGDHRPRRRGPLVAPDRRPGRLPRPRRGAQRAGAEPRDGRPRVALPPRGRGAHAGRRRGDPAAADARTCPLVVVSNQPSAAKGTTDLEALAAVHDAVMRSWLAEAGVAVDEVRYCFHHPARRRPRARARLRLPQAGPGADPPGRRRRSAWTRPRSGAPG